MNENIWFMDKEAMTAGRIVKVLTKCSMSELWDPLFLPFCGDEEDMLIIDTASGRVFHWDAQDGTTLIIHALPYC